LLPAHRVYGRSAGLTCPGLSLSATAGSALALALTSVAVQRQAP
jgi:hypothetical protein